MILFTVVLTVLRANQVACARSASSPVIIQFNYFPSISLRAIGLDVMRVLLEVVAIVVMKNPGFTQVGAKGIKKQRRCRTAMS